MTAPGLCAAPQAMEMEAQRRRRSSLRAVRHITVDDLAVLQYVPVQQLHIYGALGEDVGEH
jgi:hypothetical protein